MIEGALWSALAKTPQWQIYRPESTTNPTNQSVSYSPQKWITQPPQSITEKLTSAINGVGIAGFTIGNAQNKYADSFYDFEIAADSRISNYPVQPNGFASYNKVQMPNIIVTKLTKGGTDSDRQGFLFMIDQIKLGTDLYTIITPEIAYQNMNLFDYSFTRESNNGANLIVISLKWQEIRQIDFEYYDVNNPTVSTNNASNPSDQPSTGNGNVQTTAPSQSVLQNIGSGITNAVTNLVNKFIQ
jgi:hypothetical protein